MSNNRLGPDAAQRLADAARGSTSLLALRAGFNPLGRAGACALVESLRENASIAVLGVENAATGAQEREVLLLADDVLRARSRMARVVVAFPERDLRQLMACVGGRGGGGGRGQPCRPDRRSAHATRQRGGLCDGAWRRAD